MLFGRISTTLGNRKINTFSFFKRHLTLRACREAEEDNRTQRTSSNKREAVPFQVLVGGK